MIRRATFADVPALRWLFTQLVAELETSRMVAYPTHDAEDLDAFTLLTARRLESDPTLLLYLATDDATGEPLAFLGGEIGQRALGHPRVFGAAHWLYVRPEARKLGLARGLVRFACQDLAALGITHVELAALRGDLQWATRGWIPYLIHHVLPLEAVVAAAAERPTRAPAPVETPPPPPPATVEPAPVTAAPRRQAGRKRRRRRIRAVPAPKRAAEAGA